MESPGRGRGGNGGVGRGRGGTKRENKKSINKGHAGRGKFQQERGKGKSARGAASLRGRGGKAVQEQPPPRHQQGGPRSDVSSAQRFFIGRLGPLTKKPLPPGDQHRMRKLVLSALNCENDDEVVRLLTTVPGISSLQTIATTVFSIDAGDRRGLFSFQAIAVPFCRLLRTRIAISSDFSGVIKIFSQLCRGGSTFFSLERGSAISCLIECATEPEMIVAGAGQDDNTKYLPRSVQEMFDDVLDAIRQLFVNMKDEAKQEKWPGILSLLEVHVPTACLQNFTHIRSLVMEGNGQQQLQTGELGRKARTGARPILSANSLPGELCPTGARHDNDHEDYRQIRVLPTSQEMHSEVQPYLPKQYLLEKDDHRGSEFLVDDVDRHVDIQFRLLREDMVRTLRCGTQALALHGGLPGLAPRKYRHRLRVQSSAIHCAIMRNVAIVGFVPSSRTALAFKVSFDHPCPNDKKFWDPKVCRLLRKGQLVSVLLDSYHQLSLTATVSGRIEQQAPSSRCVVELELVAGTKENIALLLQYADSRREETTEIGLMEIGGVQIFAYKPVLSALQAQTSAKVPFLRRVVPSKGQPECCTERLPAFVTPSTRLDLRCLVRDGVAVPPELASVSIDSYAQLEALFERPRVEESLRMDRTQAKAFAAAFSRDIALIQGPPGTGKTFVGVEILRALLSNSVGYPRTTWDEATPPATEIDGKPLLDPIVCITFTNHALDQILEHLIDEGIATTADIVRLGSRSKSERLEKCSLYAKERDEWSGRDGREKYSMEDRAEKVIKEIENAMKMLSRREGAAWTEHVLEFLDPDLLFQLERTLAREIESGFEDVDGSGCLAMLRRQSLEEYNLYQEMAEEALVEDIFYKFQALEKLSDDIERLRTGVKLRVAKKARVIAMTTTGCAMHSQLIKMLRPKVILCEEAGEVLESHMLSALTDRTQSLILIGDHLQLRPKPAEYDLSVESGRGYDLDVSLFERLVMSRAPSVMLLEQRRMQPRISSLLRYTLYPLLVDHPSVEQHPPLRGFAESLLFFDHDHPEVGASESTSKVNRFEVEMVTAIVEYAVRNGYQGSRVAVLTPYLGQLRHIRLALSGHKMTVFVDERTEEDLLEEKLLGEDVIEEDDGQEPATQPTDAASFSVEKLRDCVRLSTVDNFQGEEADLVIVSTVRCNTEGSVGFLATDNRVNVMLSRARHGMIILGSSRTVFHKLGSRGKPPTMFQTVLRLLEAESAVVRALPLICERHPNEVTLAKTPGDVPKHGGCERPCTSRLSCGHRCRSLCHPDNKSHQAVACREDCAKLLACGHPCKELCQKPCGNCREQVLCTLPCGHGITLSCDRATAFKQNPAGSGIVCIREVPVPKHLQKLACGHVLEKALCHELKASALTCVKECSKSPWDCGHSCTRPCSECHRPGLPPNHGLCSHPCGRVLLCGHICTATPCHDGSSCPPCQEKCAIRCAHSTCPLPCQAACNPCVEPCVWKCTVEHEGMQKCVLRCSAACTRRPCDVRCDQILMCGHRCPSLCGEVCPDAGGCPQCAAEGKLSPDRASSIVDFIMYVELKDHTVDDGDIGTCLVQLNCGHAFTVEYLDTKTQLESFYERSQDSWGQPTFLDTFTLENKQMAKCDLCPAPLLGPRRYSRCIKGREVHLLDVKWSHDCKVKLAEIETMVSSLPAGQGSTKAFNAVKKDASVFYNSVVKLKRASPAEKCIPHNQLPRAAATRAAMARAHACAAQCLVEVEMIKRKLAAVSRQPSEKNAEHEDAFRHHKKALWLLDRLEKMYKEGLAYATDGSSSTAASTLHGNFAKGLCQVFELLHTLTSRTPHPPSREIMQRTLSSLKGLVAGDQAVKAKFAAIVPVLTMQLDKARDMTADEKRAVFTAMQRDVGSGIGGYGGHWFECPNGHPYAIGECGGAMEVSKCIDCGAEVGGSSHRRRSDNKVAVGLLSSVGGPIPSRLS